MALYHIERSYFVDATAIDLSRYTLGPQVQISEECDFMELLGSTASAVERQIDDHLQRVRELSGPSV